MARFVIATSGMVALLALGLAFGGAWAWAALLCITVVTYFLDRIAALAAPDHPEREFPAGDGLAALLGLVHFPLLYAGAWAVAGHGAHGHGWAPARYLHGSSRSRPNSPYVLCTST